MLLPVIGANAQTLKVILSPDKQKVDREAGEGISTIVFDSKVKDLEISNLMGDECLQLSNNYIIYRIDTDKDKRNGLYYSHRVFLLNSPKSSEYVLEIDEIQPKQFLYYTVVLPDKYPVTLSAEWLMNIHSQKGIRIGYGGRYGFIVGCTWGDYRPSGDNINAVTSDCDLSYAKLRGYIRTTIFGGFRMGLIHSTNFSMFTYLGLGYGEYGRQWENKARLENSKYFYSDYIKGVNANLGLNFHLFDYLSLSLGGDMIMNSGKFMLDCQLGLGIFLKTDNWLKRKIK